jgi:hypothetical protein
VRRARTPEHQLPDTSYVLSRPEIKSYRVVLANDRLILFYTHSFTSSAYLSFFRSGPDEAWEVGWLRGGTSSHVGTFRF